MPGLSCFHCYLQFHEIKTTINVENDPKLESTDTEFEATEEIKERENREGFWGKPGPDLRSEESAGDCGRCQEAGGDQETPGGVEVVWEWICHGHGGGGDTRILLK